VGFGEIVADLLFASAKRAGAERRSARITRAMSGQFVTKGGQVYGRDGALVADIAKHYAATGTGHPGGGDAAEPRGADRIADRVIAGSRLHSATKEFSHAHEAYKNSLFGQNNKAERQRTSRAADRAAEKLSKAQDDARKAGLSSKAMQGIHGRAMADAEEERYQNAEREGMQLPEAEASRRADSIIANMRGGK
jgi:hypothetical protein